MASPYEYARNIPSRVAPCDEWRATVSARISSRHSPTCWMRTVPSVVVIDWRGRTMFCLRSLFAARRVRARAGREPDIGVASPSPPGQGGRQPVDVGHSILVAAFQSSTAACPTAISAPTGSSVATIPSATHTGSPTRSRPWLSTSQSLRRRPPKRHFARLLQMPDVAGHCSPPSPPAFAGTPRFLAPRRNRPRLRFRHEKGLDRELMGTRTPQDRLDNSRRLGDPLVRREQARKARAVSPRGIRLGLTSGDPRQHRRRPSQARNRTGEPTAPNPGTSWRGALGEDGRPGERSDGERSGPEHPVIAVDDRE